MDSKNIWKNIFQKYQDKGLDNKPSIFSQQVIEYIKGKKFLLDLGAGLGQDSRFFDEQGFFVTCTDNSEHALELAKLKAGNGNINFLQIDLEKEFPFSDGSFDVVYSHLALHYFDNRTTKEIFQKIHKVLKSGGIFAALFNTIDDPEIKESHFRKIEENYYQEGEGLKKRYFCVDCLKVYTNNLFKPLIIDNKGRTYKDQIESLIRFVGKKI